MALKIKGKKLYRLLKNEVRYLEHLWAVVGLDISLHVYTFKLNWIPQPLCLAIKETLIISPEPAQTNKMKKNQDFFQMCVNFLQEGLCFARHFRQRFNYDYTSEPGCNIPKKQLLMIGMRWQKFTLAKNIVSKCLSIPRPI